jgi:hypothetical protein
VPVKPWHNDAPFEGLILRRELFQADAQQTLSAAGSGDASLGRTGLRLLIIDQRQSTLEGSATRPYLGR